jgi:putative membrane protein
MRKTKSNKPKWERVFPLSEERIDMKIKKHLLLMNLAMWPSCVFAQGNHMDGGRMNGGYMGGYGHMMNSWTGAFIMGIALLILIGVLVYLLFRSSGKGTFGSVSHETPMEILKKRYAKGEVTKAQFDEMKKDL